METIIDVLANIKVTLEKIEEEEVKTSFILLLNLVDNLASEKEELKEENQELKDIINRMKGEHGSPPKRSEKKAKNISSEKERKKKKEAKKSKKRNRRLKKIEIHREEKCLVRKENIPEDAVFKGYESVIIQDIKIIPENTKFKRAVYYSPSEKKTYRGKLPNGYDGEFGPGIKSLIYSMKYICNMSEPKILEFLENFDIQISGTYISNTLTKKVDMFHEEKTDIYNAGLASSKYQQIDDTTAIVDGEKCYTHVMCNPFYTAYFTKKRKDRLSILDVLRNSKERTFLFNNETIELLEKLKVSKKIIAQLEKIEKNKQICSEKMEEILDSIFCNPKQGKNSRIRIAEAAAIAAYHQESNTLAEILISDDAPQFKHLTKELGLCWIHEGRHYKKLNPILELHQENVKQFIEQFWMFYRKLLDFKKFPTAEKIKILSREFDELFSTRTYYQKLNDRIAKTKEKKEELLTVLFHPEIPVHNNASELGARVQVRRRDVSLQTRTEEGTQANDTFSTIVQTAKKLSVNAYQYIYDRVSQDFKLPSLADIIKQKNSCPNT